VAVAAVSRDSPHSHRRYSETLYISIPLLSDWSGEATAGFGIGRALDGMPGVPKRCSFLLGADQRVHGEWIHDDNELPDLDAILSAAARLQAGPGIDE
jgi:peroxiredoxin